MTEVEWLNCTDPTPMLEFVRDKASDRKLRLLAVASCRRVRHLFEDARSLQGVETAERFADGEVDEKCLEAALWEAHGAKEDASYANTPPETFVPRNLFADAVRSLTQPPTDRIPESGRIVQYDGWHALAMIARALAVLHPNSAVERPTIPKGDMIYESGTVYTDPVSLEEQTHQAHLLRDIFGNPFRPAVLDPS